MVTHGGIDGGSLCIVHTRRQQSQADVRGCREAHWWDGVAIVCPRCPRAARRPRKGRSNPKVNEGAITRGMEGSDDGTILRHIPHGGSAATIDGACSQHQIIP